MRVEIAEEQKCLKKHQACIPDRGCSPKQRKNEPGEEWLDPEEKKRAHERGSAEDCDHLFVSEPQPA